VKTPPSLFEVSFEVCNKVGGIYTVLSTKAPTLTERLGDDYICIGPWLLHDAEESPVPFEAEPGFESFEESCREMGLPVQVGRWTIPGRPRTILVEFSSLYEEKDEVLADLWEQYQVDSIEGDWDYVEPVLFGVAAARIIEAWWEEHLAPQRKRAVAQFHEWMTGSGLLYLNRATASIGTIFTTHATMLGRALSSLGRSPEDGLGEDTAEDLARQHGVTAKHSIEGTCARVADVFTTVSTLTAAEAELLHRRAPEPVLPNGIDLGAIDTIAGDAPREEVRARLLRVAHQLVGEDVSDACLIATSGRYEFHNKGLDQLLDACAKLEEGADGEKRRAVVFFLVPAGNSGLRAEMRARDAADQACIDGPLGLSTHNLFHEEGDPIVARCAELGLANEPGSRVKVVFVPIYLSEHDDLLGFSYEAVVRAMDLTAFPSFYEPWGYTPQESLALGVPTITTDHAGFGRWVQATKLGPKDGVTVVNRARRTYEEGVDQLVQDLEAFLAKGSPASEAACRATAQRTAWTDLIANYDQAFELALEAVQQRLVAGVPLRRKPRRAVSPRGEGRAPRLTRFEVSATLPEVLAPLQRIARNFAWCWDPEGADLFRDLSPQTWSACEHNPVLLLRRAPLKDLEARAADLEYVECLQRVAARLDAYLDEPPALAPELADAAFSPERPIAYFSAEFGLHESLRIYSGGLGILAGDHLKSASDLGLPLVAVGLFYHKGYMAQRLTAEGEQIADGRINDPRDLALEQVLGADGKPLEVRLSLPGNEVVLRAWRAEVGRVPLYLLDSDVPANREEDREITTNLYGGGDAMRIRQEIVLGRGGARLLRALGIRPSVWHLNEGHSAFACLERTGRLVREEGLTFAEAREVVRATTIFTTHTPVPAGHDRFGEDLLRKHFSDVEQWLGLPWEEFLELGVAGDGDERFNLTALALQFSSRVNGVSEIHGGVSRRLLGIYWPALLEDEVPVGSITNGVHLGSWVAPRIGALVGAEARPVRGTDFAARAADVDLADLWEARRHAKGRLLELVRGRTLKSFLERNDSPALLNRILDGADDGALWIGFARRFAPYKRAHLVFSNRDRLRALLSNEERPVRLLVAGKAHPRDEHGQAILRDIVQLARSDEFAGRVVLCEDYDIELGRALVQGVDVWLNTPTRDLEASGTSGMKAAANGGLNLSIADGWWPEGANGKNGWTIGDDRVYEDQDLQDQLDAEGLYQLLEGQVVPLFFERDSKDLPTGWLERARDSIATLPPIFDTDRMVGEYAGTGYLPLAGEGRRCEDRRRPRERARLKARLREHFPTLRAKQVEVSDLSEVRVGDLIEAHVELELGGLAGEEVLVELVVGQVRTGGEHLEGGRAVVLRPVGETTFEGGFTMDRSGQYAYGLRVRAAGELGDPGDALRDFVRWIG